MSLQWPDINVANGEIIIRAEHAKSKKHRVLPIYGDMTEALKRQKSERDEKYPNLEWVFHDGDGNRLRTFYKAWKSAATEPSLMAACFMIFDGAR